jgi:hypothetical protein
VTKEEANKLQQECIDYIENLRINVKWRHQRFIRYWLMSYTKKGELDSDNLVPSWEEEDGRNMHLTIGFMVDDTNYDSNKRQNYNGLYVTIQRYSFRSYVWDRKLGFLIKSLEQFKHIITAIIKI